MSEAKKGKKLSDMKTETEEKDAKKKGKKKKDSEDIAEDNVADGAKTDVKEESKKDSNDSPKYNSRFEYEQVEDVEVKNCIIKISKRSDGCVSFAPEKSFTRDGQEVTFIPKNSSIVLLKEDAKDLICALAEHSNIELSDLLD